MLKAIEPMVKVAGKIKKMIANVSNHGRFQKLIIAAPVPGILSLVNYFIDDIFGGLLVFGCPLFFLQDFKI